MNRGKDRDGDKGRYEDIEVLSIYLSKINK
jgi:hypothetical protein